MSGFGKRENDGHERYIMNQQIALPVPYNQGDGHEFNVNESGTYYSQQSFNSYTPHFTSPYSHPVRSSHIHLLSPHHSPGHSIPSAPEHTALQHQSVQYLPQDSYIHSRYLPIGETLEETVIESQESRNENTMLSEPVIPQLDGFPNVREFDQLMKSYVDDLSVKKQDKALIHAKRARNIWTVLLDPKDTAVESAQFRFWVKKMFKLQPIDGTSLGGAKIICHEGKPVAIREKLFKILTRAHQQCQHGGRDKTSAQVRHIYSWVRKELISRFVKICPTCQVRRGGSRLTPSSSRRGSPRLTSMRQPPKLLSPPMSRRESIFNGLAAAERSQPEYFHQLDNSNGWADSHRSLQARQTSNLSLGHMRSSSAGAFSNMPGSILPTMDPFHAKLFAPSSQVSYNQMYASNQGPPSH